MCGVLRLILLVATCYGQASANTPPGSTTTYHNDAMNLAFSYPSGFVNKSENDSDAAPKHGDKSGTETKDCVSTPIAAMDMRFGFNMIFMRRYDGTCVGKEIADDRGQIAVSFLKNTLQEFGKPEVGSSEDYESSGHSAATASGTVALKQPAGTIIYGTGTCFVTGKDLGCFVFLANECKTLGTTLSASTVKFADSAVAPIIPAKFAPTCTPGRKPGR
jgi:hypothetical protein